MTRIHQDARLVEPLETLFQAGSLCGLSDGALLDRFQAGGEAGSEAAFTELLKRHGPMVLGACRRILADPHLAEDALQAVFLVLARRAGSVRNPESLGGWLHRVACRIAWRSRERSDRRKAREEPMVEDVAARAADSAEDFELRAIIDQEIDRLRDAQRLPVVLCFLQGLSHEEAANRLRLPLGTVKSRLARGRETLQQRLVRRGVAPALAAAAASGSRGVEAAVLSPSLVKSTAALALKSAAAGAGASATVSALVREELHSALAVKLKLAAATTVGGMAIAAVGFLGPTSLGRNPRPEEASQPAASTAEPRKEDPPPVVASLSASGRVVDVEGKPIAGAMVRLREWTVRRTRGISEPRVYRLIQGETLNDVLAEQPTDADGKFHFKDVPAPGFLHSPEVGKTEFPWDVVALAPGRGLAWVQLTRTNQTKALTLTLGDEGLVRGTVVETDEKPVAGAKVTVFAIDEPGRVNDPELETDGRLNLIWSGFLTKTTGADGRFEFRGLPQNKVAALVVTEPRHERMLVHVAVAKPGSEQETPVRVSSEAARAEGNSEPTTYRGDLVLLTRVTDHVLRGRVVFESNRKPASNATFMNGWHIEKLDQDGRFRIKGLAAGKVDLHAYDRSSEAGPGEVEVSIPEKPKETEYTLVLPRGLVVRGRVVDGSSGRGVGGVEVRFHAEPRRDSRFGFVERTDADGRYRLVVPAGSGVVEAVNLPDEYERPAKRSIGEPPGASYAKSVDGRAGETIELLDIALRRADESSIRVVDGEGRPVFHAEVKLLDATPRPKPVTGRTDAYGRYRVAKRDAGQSATVDVVSPDREQGGTAEVPRDDAPGKRSGPIEVRLEPLGSLSGRVLDELGAALPGATLILYRNVSYPETAGASFGKPVESGLVVAKDGTFTAKRLIPGATYSIHVEADGHATSTSRQVKIKPGENVELASFRLPTANRELSGTVVDPRGKPVAGATVSYDRQGRNQALSAPKNAVWFENSDSEGRFHLTGLPPGPFRLMVYRNEGAERAIRNLKYFEVAEGQKDVRIELPDANERLRGIE